MAFDAASPLGKDIARLQSTNNNRNINDKVLGSRVYFFGKLVQTITLRPLTTATVLALHTIKLLTWVPIKSGFYKVSGYHTQSAAFMKGEYLETVKAFRDFLFIPSIAKRAFQDMVGKRQDISDDTRVTPTAQYLKVSYDTRMDQFSSYQHGLETFRVIRPKEINEFPATSDAALLTIMASHIFHPGILAINFGSPNVATFITEKQGKDDVETTKVDAKSLWREPMTYHATSGKMQSGIFFVATTLPPEALERFKKAAEAMQGLKNITCVNTNCRVLQTSGFSIEGVALDEVVFPTTLMEHLLFRRVYYTDFEGKKHRVHFDILNTTQNTLEQFCEEVDTAVVGTRYRHDLRNADTVENQKMRSLLAQALIKEEKEHLASLPITLRRDHDYKEDFTRRKITISVPSLLGDALARIWGRHTIFEVDLSDKRKEIAEAFQQLAEKNNQKSAKLLPFPQEKPSLLTRLKRDIFFSGPAIRFLRRHMMGREDEMHLHTEDLFRHLKTTRGERLNYVLLDDKVVLARVQVNDKAGDAHRIAADWALSKHALLADRQKVNCSGEIWYNEAQDRYEMNGDSGSYMPTLSHVEVAARLANEFFGNHFVVENPKAKPNKQTGEK